MDYIVGRGGLACEFETYFGNYKFLEIHKKDSEYDCRVFDNRYQSIKLEPIFGGETIDPSQYYDADNPVTLVQLGDLSNPLLLLGAGAFVSMIVMEKKGIKGKNGKKGKTIENDEKLRFLMTPWQKDPKQLED